MTKSLPTRGQLERTLSQSIQALYRQELGHQPSKVTCQLFEDKLAIIIEESITPAEEILLQEGQDKLAKQVRSSLDDALQSKLKNLIEDVIKVKIVDLLSDSTLKTCRTGIIAVFNKTPEVRIIKVKNDHK